VTIWVYNILSIFVLYSKNPSLHFFNPLILSLIIIIQNYILKLKLHMKNYIVGIAGGTGSGKTTVTDKIVAGIGHTYVSIIDHDSYYKDLSTFNGLTPTEINYDHPSSLETDLLVEHLHQLKHGFPINKPLYNFTTHHRKTDTLFIEPRKIIIVDGILIFSEERLRDLFDLKIFIDTDADERMIRRLNRDIIERGRSFESVINQYLNTVKPMHLQFVEPSKRWADIIIPRGGSNQVAIDTVISKIKTKMND
jgi:uridine kinase